ncbi:MAG: hypothetical protein ACYC35_01150 [Pirellulales bacterium]
MSSSTITRKIIVSDLCDRTAVVDQAVKALAARGGLYQCDGRLCEIITPPPSPPGLGRRPASPYAHAIGRPRLQELLSGAASWLWRADDGRLWPCHPRPWAVSGVLKRGDWPGVPSIDAAEEGGAQ